MGTATTPSLYSLLALSHLFFGTLALSAFWIAAFARKGSRIHRGAGKTHLIGMTGVLASAAPMSLEYLLHRSAVLGLFLAYLFVLVGTAVWCGWRAIRDRDDWRRYTGTGYRTLMWLNLTSGAATVVLGLFFMPTLKLVTVVIGLLGMASFVSMRMFLRHPPDNSRWWQEQHFTSMIQSGAGNHVAFLFFGLPKLLPMLAGTVMQQFAWLAPIVVAGVAIQYLRRKHAPRRSRMEQAA
jgi:hypothetical protein